MRKAGGIVAQILEEMAEMAKPGFRPASSIAMPNLGVRS